MVTENWEASRQRFEALWRRERADRSCVSIRTLKDPARPVVCPPHRPEEFFRRSVTDPEFLYGVLRENIEKVYYAGDAFPSANLYLGTGGHCGYTKKYCHSFESNSVWFDPVMEDVEAESIEYDDNSELLGITRRMVDYLERRHRQDFFVSNTDNCSSLDALANLRDSADLLMDMMEQPEQIKRHLRALQDILHRTEREIQDRLLPLNDGGTVTDWMGLWCPGRHHQLQCDLSVMISPALFEEFALPELEENAAFFEHTVYHLDGQEQVRHLDMILSVKGIDLIQWTPVAGQPETSAFLEVLKRIQKAGKGLVLMPHSYEMPRLLDELDPAGVLYYLWDIPTRQEADEMVELVAKKTGRGRR